MKGLSSVFPNAAWIARREYFVRVRGRSFLVSTIVLALVSFAVVLAPVVIQYLSQGARVRIAVYEAASGLPTDTIAVLDQSLFGAPVGGESPGTGREFELRSATDLATAESDLRTGAINGLLIICRADGNGNVAPPCSMRSAAPATPQANDLVFEYRADVSANGRQAFYVRQAANALAIEDRGTRAGVDLAALSAPARLTLVNPKTASGPAATGGSDAARSDQEEVSRVLTATALIILIFIVVISYGTWVAMSVAEEKSSRVMELMLSAATPIQMLTGKVIGNGLAGFTQYLAILLAGGVALLVQGRVATAILGDSGSGGAPLGGLTAPALLAFGVFFVLGFVLYALLYAAAGSMVSRQEDVQQAAMPLMMLSMAGYFSATFALQDITASWVTALSFVPFFSPYLMLARLLLTTVAPWEIAVAVVLLFATIVVALWVAARIYSAGVLLYGQRAGLRQIISAARVAR